MLKLFPLYSGQQGDETGKGLWTASAWADYAGKAWAGAARTCAV